MAGIFSRVLDISIRRAEFQFAREIASDIKGTIHDLTGGILGRQDQGGFRGFQPPPRPTGYDRPMGQMNGGGYLGRGYGGAEQQSSSNPITALFRGIGDAFKGVFAGLGNIFSGGSQTNSPLILNARQDNSQAIEAMMGEAGVGQVNQIALLTSEAGIDRNRGTLKQNFAEAASGEPVTVAALQPGQRVAATQQSYTPTNGMA